MVNKISSDSNHSFERKPKNRVNLNIPTVIAGLSVITFSWVSLKILKKSRVKRKPGKPSKVMRKQIKSLGAKPKPKTKKCNAPKKDLVILPFFLDKKYDLIDLPNHTTLEVARSEGAKLVSCEKGDNIFLYTSDVSNTPIVLASFVAGGGVHQLGLCYIDEPDMEGRFQKLINTFKLLNPLEEVKIDISLVGGFESDRFNFDQLKQYIKKHPSLDFKGAFFNLYQIPRDLNKEEEKCANFCKLTVGIKSDGEIVISKSLPLIFDSKLQPSHKMLLEFCKRHGIKTSKNVVTGFKHLTVEDKKNDNAKFMKNSFIRKLYVFTFSLAES